MEFERRRAGKCHKMLLKGEVEAHRPTGEVGVSSSAREAGATGMGTAGEKDGAQKEARVRHTCLLWGPGRTGRKKWRDHVPREVQLEREMRSRI